MTHQTWTQVLYTAQISGGDGGNNAAMFDSGNNRIKALRPGAYSLQTFAYVQGMGVANDLSLYAAQKNSINGPDGYNNSPKVTLGGAGRTGVFAIEYYGCALNDYFTGSVYINGASGDAAYVAVAQYPWLRVVEIPTW